MENRRNSELADQQFNKARQPDFEQASQGDWEAFMNGGLAERVAAGAAQYYRKPIPQEEVALSQASGPTRTVGDSLILIQNLAKGNGNCGAIGTARAAMTYSMKSELWLAARSVVSHRPGRAS